MIGEPTYFERCYHFQQSRFFSRLERLPDNVNASTAKFQLILVVLFELVNLNNFFFLIWNTSFSMFFDISLADCFYRSGMTKCTNGSNRRILREILLMRIVKMMEMRTSDGMEHSK